MFIAFLNPQGNFDPRDRYWTEHPDFGGQLVYVKEVALALGALGHRVDIVTRRILDPEWPGFEAVEDSYPGGSNVRILRISCGGYQFLPKEDLWPHLGTEWVPNLIRWYERENALPRVAATHYGDGGLAGAFAQQRAGIPFTFTAHSLGAQKMDKLGASPETIEALDARFHFRSRIAAERISMNHAGRIITSTMQERLQQYGHPAYRGAIDPGAADRFAVISPGVNLGLFNPDPSSQDEPVRRRIDAAIERDISETRRDYPAVIASSRLDEKKNHMGLVRAFAASPDLQAAANLLLVIRGASDPLRAPGDLSPGERAIMEQVTAHMDTHHLWGVVGAFPLNSQAELAAGYRYLAERGSIFALTAFYEPFGLAPLEAMSCGLPAVVTKNGGPSESMREGEKEFGVLVDPEDPQDIAEGMLRLLRQPEVWQTYREAARERVLQQYTWEHTAESYAAVFERVLTDPRQAPSIPIHEHFSHPEVEIPMQQLIDLYFGDEG